MRLRRRIESMIHASQSVFLAEQPRILMQGTGLFHIRRGCELGGRYSFR